MSSITTINGSDVISTSRTVINTNFSNLNTDKIETSVLDTDTTLAANSDSKVATQKAVKAYIDSGSTGNASETQKGVVEEATDAEVTAGTSTGATGAKLFITPTKLATRLATISPSVTSVFSRPDFPSGAIGLMSCTGNTTGFCGRIVISAPITTQKIFIDIGSHSVSGTVKIGLFSEDGQTRLISVTTATITTTGLVTTAVSSTSIPAGIYYVVIVPVSTTNTGPRTHTFLSGAVLLANPSSEPVSEGTITVTADTMPTTITPSSITYASSSCCIFRLDN